MAKNTQKNAGNWSETWTMSAPITRYDFYVGMALQAIIAKAEGDYTCGELVSEAMEFADKAIEYVGV